MSGPPPSSDPGYGGTPASMWGEWIRHDGGEKPAFVAMDFDSQIRAPFGDAVDYRTARGRGIGRNWSPPWSDIEWYRLLRAHPYYGEVPALLDRLRSIERETLAGRTMPFGDADAYDRLAEGIAPWWGKQRLRQRLAGWILDPAFSAWDAYLGLTLLALITGPRPWWWGLPIAGVWLLGRLWAQGARR